MTAGLNRLLLWLAKSTVDHFLSQSDMIAENQSDRSSERGPMVEIIDTIQGKTGYASAHISPKRGDTECPNSCAYDTFTIRSFYEKDFGTIGEVAINESFRCS